VTAERVPSSPYKGLATFEDSDLDALFFFGRERDTEIIAANLLAARFTVLYGSLGVGKSSVLRAGVSRRLRALAPDAAVVVYDSWAGDAATGLLNAVADGVEGERPQPDRPVRDALAELTGRFGSDVLLVLDQFEELFVYPHAQALAYELADVVTRADLRVNVLIALREDALAELDVLTGRVPNVFGNYLALDRIDRAAGRAAIVEPLARFNELSDEQALAVEPELVEAVLDEVDVGRVEWRGAFGEASVGAAPGRIEAPYLQLVMQRLWEVERERESRVLRLATLEELGGAVAIVKAHLDQAMQVLEPHQRDVAARVFNQLVTPSGTKIAHDVADLAEYAGVGEGELRTVVASLGRERILRPVDGRYEIFHDVLADAVLAWRNRHEAERALERQRAEADRRQRRLLGLLAVAGIVLAAMAGLTIYALTQRSEAGEQARAAEAEARRARGNALAADARALLPGEGAEIDPELGLLLAAEAARLSPSRRTADTLRRALLVSHIRAILPDRGVTAASFSPDGSRIAVGTADGVVRIYSSDRRNVVATFEVGGAITSASWSANGQIVLTTAEGSPAQTWDVTGDAVGSFGRAASEASFSEDGTRVLTLEPDGTRIWDTADGTLVARLGESEPARGASFGPDGQLAVTFARGVARIFDARSGAPRAVLRHGGEITSATFTPDGSHLVTTGENKFVRYWGVGGRGNLIRELTGHSGAVTAGIVSPDGTRLVTTSADGTGKLWALPAGTLIADLFGHKNLVAGAAFSRDSQSFVTWSTDGTARVWDRGRRAARVVLAGHEGAVTSAAFDPAGDTILTASADGRARLWRSRVDSVLEPIGRAAERITVASFSENGAVAAVAGPADVEVLRSRDGMRIASLRRPSIRALAVNGDGSLVAASQPGGTWLWQTGSGKPMPSGSGLQATALAFSAAGNRLAVGAASGRTEVWTAGGSEIAGFDRPGRRVTSVALSPGGGALAVGYGDGALEVWDLGERGRRYQALGHKEGTAILSLAFSWDGRRLVTAGTDATIRVWDAFTADGSYALRAHSQPVEDAALSPSGHWVASASVRVAGLFDVPSRQRFLYLVGHPGRALAVSFDRTGRRISVVAADATLRAYACAVCTRIPGLLPLAERRLAATGRKLTLAERSLYFGTR
jgi:WD40 repeat protein